MNIQWRTLGGSSSTRFILPTNRHITKVNNSVECYSLILKEGILSGQLSLQEKMRKFLNYFLTKLSSIAGVDCHKTRLRFSCFLLYFWLWFLSSADSWKGLDFLFFPLIILTLIFVRITKEHRVCRPLNRAITWWSEIANTSWFPRQLLNWVPCQHSLRLFQTKLEGIFRLVAQPFFQYLISHFPKITFKLRLKS